MRILLIAKDMWGYSGGSEQYLAHLIKPLAQAGHEITLMYGEKSSRPIQERLPIHAEYMIPSLNRYPSRRNASDIQKVLDVVEKEKIDVVYLREMKNYAVVKALTERCPTIARFHSCIVTCLRDGTKTYYLSRQICRRRLGTGCYLHGCFISKPEPGKRLPRFNDIRHAEKRLRTYQGLRTILVASRYMKNELIQNGFKAENIVVLPHNPFETVEMHKKDVSYDSNTILFAGRIDRYKGVDFLLKALSAVERDCKAYIIGEGPYLETFKRLCAKLKLQEKVTFFGWLPNSQLRDLYPNVRMVALPSIWPEPFPRVGVEAQSFARPIVGFDVGGMSDLVKDGVNGFLVAKKDWRSLAERITQLLDDEVLAETMGLNGYRDYCIRPNHMGYIRQLERVFRETIENSSAQDII